MTGHSRVYGDRDEAYIGSGEGVKENSVFRAGRVEFKLLRWLAETGLRRFNLTEAARGIGEDVRRVYQAVAYLIKRSIFAREARGWYRVLVDPWELLKRIVVQGPNAQRVKEGVKESDGTRSEWRGSNAISSVAGLFFDNVRGYTVSGEYIRGDRDRGGGRGRVLTREDLVRFSKVSYAEVSIATGTRLLEGLGSLTIYFKCKWHGVEYICSDWVEWRPSSGFYRQHSVVDAVNTLRSKVLPYGFGLIGRAAAVIGAPMDKLRAAVYGLARQVYLALRPGYSSSSSSNGCRAPAVELNDDGSFSVCFKCPPTLYRRLINSARVARRDWNSIVVEILSGVLP